MLSGTARQLQRFCSGYVRPRNGSQMAPRVVARQASSKTRAIWNRDFAQTAPPQGPAATWYYRILGATRAATVFRTLRDMRMSESSTNVLLWNLTLWKLGEFKAIHGVQSVSRQMDEARAIPNAQTYEILTAIFCRSNRAPAVTYVLRHMAKHRVVPTAKILHYLMFLYGHQERFSRSLMLLKQFVDLGVTPYLDTLLPPLRFGTNLYLTGQISLENVQHLTQSLVPFADQLSSADRTHYVGLLTMTDPAKAEFEWNRRVQTNLKLTTQQMGRLMLAFAKTGSEQRVMEVLGEIEARKDPDYQSHWTTASLATLYSRTSDHAALKALEARLGRSKLTHLHPAVKDAFMEYYALNCGTPAILARGVAFFDRIRRPSKRNRKLSKAPFDVRRHLETYAVTVLLAYGDFKSAIDIIAVSLEYVPPAAQWSQWIELCLKHDRFDWAFTVKDYAFGAKLPESTYELLLADGKRRQSTDKVNVLLEEMKILGYSTPSLSGEVVV